VQKGGTGSSLFRLRDICTTQVNFTDLADQYRSPGGINWINFLWSPTTSLAHSHTCGNYTVRCL